ncbi:MAG: FtsW/RodA/SpoVE family cell cycle protein [Bacteroidia bacterium]|nr:FtsW/RodA/SpoVE family cell cycle protein [Bacteroidia bacterium]
MKMLNNIKSDRTVWIIVLLICIFSLLVVYSSSNVLAHKFRHGDTASFLFKQFLVIAVGFGLMIGMHFINYKYYSRLSQLAYLCILPLLVLTLVMGKSENGAERWLDVFGFSVQTSEIAKLVLIIYVARVLTVKQEQLKNFGVILLHLILPISLVCVLILPANFSTAAMLFVICFVMMFLGQVPLKFMAILTGGGLVLLFLFGFWVWKSPEDFKRGETWKARIAHFFHIDTGNNITHDLTKNSEENFQADMAKMAIANGKIFGVGPGNSIQKGVLPQASSDFIFAVFVEEYGLIFGVGLIFLYMTLFFRGIAILKKTDKVFGGLMVVGLSFAIIFQAFINMAVAIGLFPVTGQPLPMFSSGGTSILFTLAAIGIILSVSRRSAMEKEGKGGELEAA